MKLAIISDLHLTSEEGMSVVTPTLAEGVRALKMLIETHDRLVVGGDLFDLDLGPNLFNKADDLARIREKWAPLLEQLGHKKVAMIVGNHDLILGKEGVPDELEFGPKDSKVLVMHGHQLKPWWRVRERIKRPVKWATGRLSKTPLSVLSDVAFFVNSHKDNLGGQSKGARGGYDLLRSRRNVSLFVSGHTHRPGIWRTPHGDLANSGSWSFGRFDALSIEVKTEDHPGKCPHNVTLMDLKP